MLNIAASWFLCSSSVTNELFEIKKKFRVFVRKPHKVMTRTENKSCVIIQ